MFVKNHFCHFRTFPWLLKKICKIKTNLSEIRKALPSPPFCHCYVLQYSSFWNHKAKSYGIKTTSYAHKTTSYTPTKLQVTLTKLQVTPTKLQVTFTKLQVTPAKLQVTLTKLQVTSTKLQVTSSKLTSLTAETNKFQLTNMLFITF